MSISHKTRICDIIVYNKEHFLPRLRSQTAEYVRTK